MNKFNRRFPERDVREGKTIWWTKGWDTGSDLVEMYQTPGVSRTGTKSTRPKVAQALLLVVVLGA